jgi:hypothetical protein
MELVLFQLFDTWDFEMSPRFLIFMHPYLWAFRLDFVTEPTAQKHCIICGQDVL